MDEEISAVLTESRQARKHLRKLGKVTETVAAYRLKEMRNLQAVEKLATWRRAHGYDRIADDDNQWASRPLPLTPEQFTASLWSELNALKDAISIPRQKVRNLYSEVEQGKVSDEEFAMIKRIVERRCRDAAHATVATADTAQYRSPRSPTLEISSDVCACIEKKNEGMEKKGEGRMNPEPTELEPPSAATGFETPGQQGHPSWEAGRITAAGCLTAGVGSNLGGDTSSPTECVGTRAECVGTRADKEITTAPAASNTMFLQASRKPGDKKTAS